MKPMANHSAARQVLIDELEGIAERRARSVEALDEATLKATRAQGAIERLDAKAQSIQVTLDTLV